MSDHASNNGSITSLSANSHEQSRGRPVNRLLSAGDVLDPSFISSTSHRRIMVTKSTPSINTLDNTATTPPSTPPSAPHKSAPTSPQRYSLPIVDTTSVSPNRPRGNSLRQRLLKMVSSKHKVGEGERGIDIGDEFYNDGDHSDQNKKEEEEKEVVVMVQLNISQYKMGVDWQNYCSLDKLGIIPNRYGLVDQRQHFSSLRLKSLKNKNQDSTPVIVRGVVPSSPAALTAMLQPGDQIISVGGQEVTLSTVDRILSGHSGEVLLEVLRYCPGHRPQSLPRIHILPATAIPPQVSTSPPHLLLYLTLNTKEEDEAGADILYQYPSTSDLQSSTEQLLKLRGVFLTLSNTLSSISHSVSSCCSLLVGKELFHVSCKQFDKELLIMAFPAARLSPFQAKQLMECTEATLTVMFSSIQKAFSSSSNRSAVKQVVSLLVERQFTSPSLLPHSSLPLCSPVPPLPTKTAVRVSSLLTQFSSCDRSSHLSVLLTNRPHTPVGACLFYKGYLVSNQLPAHTMRGVVLYCHAHKLLQMTASHQVTETVEWAELFVEKPESDDPVYRVLDTKHYILAIAMETILLCQVVETGSSASPPQVDQHVVDKGRALVHKLNSTGVLSDCDRLLVGGPVPALTSADVLVAGLLSRARSVSHVTKPRSRTSVTSMQQVDSGDSEEDDRLESLTRQQSVGIEAIQSAAAGGRERPRRRGWKKAKNLSFKLRRAQSHDAIPTSLPVPQAPPTTTTPPYLLTAGPDNLLLHYVSLDKGCGVIVTPCMDHVSQQPLHCQLLATFRELCPEIRRVLLHRRAEEEEEDDDDDEERGPQQPTLSSCFCSSVIEHGVLLQCPLTTSNSDIVPTLSYWIVGRLYSSLNKEFYVCYHDNTSQVCIEMIFKMVFGTSL